MSKSDQKLLRSVQGIMKERKEIGQSTFKVNNWRKHKTFPCLYHTQFRPFSIQVTQPSRDHQGRSGLGLGLELKDGEQEQPRSRDSV